MATQSLDFPWRENDREREPLYSIGVRDDEDDEPEQGMLRPPPPLALPVAPAGYQAQWRFPGEAVALSAQPAPDRMSPAQTASAPRPVPAAGAAAPTPGSVSSTLAEMERRRLQYTVAPAPRAVDRPAPLTWEQEKFRRAFASLPGQQRIPAPPPAGFTLAEPRRAVLPPASQVPAAPPPAWTNREKEKFRRAFAQPPGERREAVQANPQATNPGLAKAWAEDRNGAGFWASGGAAMREGVIYTAAGIADIIGRLATRPRREAFDSQQQAELDKVWREIDARRQQHAGRRWPTLTADPRLTALERRARELSNNPGWFKAGENLRTGKYQPLATDKYGDFHWLGDNDGTRQSSWDMYGVDPNADNASAQAGRALFRFTGMLPYLSGRMVVAVGQMALQGYEETFQNTLDRGGTQEEAEAAAAASVPRTAMALGTYLGAGKLGGWAFGRLVGPGASALRQYGATAGGAFAGNLTAGAALRKLEGQPATGNLENWLTDGLFAGYHTARFHDGQAAPARKSGPPKPAPLPAAEESSATSPAGARLPASSAKPAETTAGEQQGKLDEWLTELHGGEAGIPRPAGTEPAAANETGPAPEPAPAAPPAPNSASAPDEPGAASVILPSEPAPPRTPSEPARSGGLPAGAASEGVARPPEAAPPVPEPILAEGAASPGQAGLNPQPGSPAAPGKGRRAPRAGGNPAAAENVILPYSLRLIKQLEKRLQEAKSGGHETKAQMIEKDLQRIKSNHEIIAAHDRALPGTAKVPIEVKWKKLTQKQAARVARPKDHRNGVRRAIWKDAVEASPDGNVRDPQSGVQMSEESKWVAGHKPRLENWKFEQFAREYKLPRRLVLDSHNRAEHYRPETKASNDNHELEDKTTSFLGY